MNLRNAVTLALVGWYLMVPSTREIPYSLKWNVIATFADYRSCDSVAAELRADGVGTSAVLITPKPSLSAWQKQFAFCDRFKPK
jgi:hypothetical protein